MGYRLWITDSTGSSYELLRVPDDWLAPAPSDLLFSAEERAILEEVILADPDFTLSRVQEIFPQQLESNEVFLYGTTVGREAEHYFDCKAFVAFATPAPIPAA